MPTDGERVSAQSDTRLPAPHFHNPPTADDLAFVSMLKESGDPLTADDTARLNAIRSKAVAVGNDHAVAVIDDLLA
jgi:hypothetical protein